MAIDELGDQAGNLAGDDDDALERSAAYDELLRRSLHRAPKTDAAEAVEPDSALADGPTADIIRLLHEVFRTSCSDHAPSAEPLPERVGRFVVHRLLGRGAFGCVYLADDPILRRQVALKVFHQHLLADESARRHVLREPEIMARLQHPNIVPVWEAGEENELIYIASEYCSGPTLAQWLADREQRAIESRPSRVFAAENIRQCASWLYDLADAVHHSHQRGIVHRDLKPGNVLLEPQGDAQRSDGQRGDRQAEDAPGGWRPRLTDFGLAKYFHAVQDETRSGLFVGSLEYASPEQVRGQLDAVGPPSDIYSLGVLLYELLTGEMPHRADSDYDLARKICEQDVVFAPGHRRTLPRDLQAITLRALEREPGNRYVSAAAMRDDLQRFLAGRPVAARPVSLVERAVRRAQKNRGVAILSGLCICLALLSVGTLIHNRRQLAIESAETSPMLFDAQGQNREAEVDRSTAHAMQKRAEESERQTREIHYLATLRSAYEAWEKNNLNDVRELLERAAAPAPWLLSADWYLLDRELTARYTSLPRMNEPVYGLAYQRGADSLLVVNESGLVRRWDLRSKTLTDLFQARSGAHALAIAPDEKTVAIGQRVNKRFGPSTLALWNLEHGGLHKDALHHHQTTLESVEYSPDGRWIASGPRYKPVVVSNLETGEAYALPSDRRNTQVAFSPTGDRLAVNKTSNKIEIHELATRKLLATIDTGPYRIASYVWLPGREVIAINARSGWGMQFYSTRTGALVASIPTRHIGESLTASTDGSWLALGSEEGRLQVFDVSDVEMADEGADVSVLPPPDVDLPPSLQIVSGFVADIEFAGNSRIVASDDEGNLACLDLSRHAYRRFHGDNAFWTSARWENEKSFTIFSSEESPERYSLEDALRASSAFPLDSPVDVVASTDGKLQAAFTRTGELAVTDTDTGRTRFLARSNPGNVTLSEEFVTLAVAISPQNDLIYTTGENNRLTAWNAADGTIAWEELLTNTGFVIVEDPNTSRLFVGGGFGTLRVHDGRSGKLISERSGGNGAKCLVIDSNHGRIISGHGDGTLRIQKLDLAQPATIHRTHGDELTAVTLSPDGRTIISGDGEGIIRVWQASGEPLGIIYGSAVPDAVVRKFLWSPSGEHLLALISGRDGQSECLCWRIGPVPAAEEEPNSTDSSVAQY